MRRLSVLAVALVAAFTVSAHIAAAFETGFTSAGGAYGSSDNSLRESAFQRTLEAQAEIVRVDVRWRDLVSGQPLDPRNPGDPAYDFSSIDRAVGGSTAHGLRVVLTIYGAPNYAEEDGRPDGVPAGTWRPEPQELADFATAVAERYSGSFQSLPRVRDYQAWNEPNLSNYLTPQFENGNSEGADHYRRMLNAFFSAIKAVNPDNRVITAGLAPYGDPPGGDRTRPLQFWRHVLCLKGRKDLRRTSCPSKASFDVLAHHPINTSGGPRQSAYSPDDVSTPDLGNLRRVLRAGERRNTIATNGRHDLWVTELWWDSKPPDPEEGVPIQKHARYIEEAFYILWKQGADVVINLQLQDQPFDVSAPSSDTSTGILFADGSKKPAFTAFRFPFVTDRESGDRVRAWGKAPAGGRLVIESKHGGGWRREASLHASLGEVFSTKLRITGKASLRARVAGERSLIWRQR